MCGSVQLYKKKMEQEAIQIRAFERELRDTSTFDTWQTGMRKQGERREEFSLCRSGAHWLFCRR
jgi:hypothetical protein